MKRTDLHADPEDPEDSEDPAHDYDTDAIPTPDRRDFRAGGPLGRHEAFRLLPEDLPFRSGPEANKPAPRSTVAPGPGATRTVISPGAPASSYPPGAGAAGRPGPVDFTACRGTARLVPRHHDHGTTPDRAPPRGGRSGRPVCGREEGTTCGAWRSSRGPRCPASCS
ncbi:hypothetical protein GCM10027160_45080 [Streptomyces calidiresistens]